MDTISKLQAELEELEKRLKAISNAQSALAHLIAIRDYFDKVQEYLEIIKDEYSSSTNSCTECNEKIENLQQQINTINDTLANPPDTEVDLTQIQTSINTISQEIENIKNGSDANLMDISTDISTLQTEIGYLQDQIDTHTSEISAINTQIGDIENTINSLRSAHTGMTSAHITMNNSINSLSNRLKTAENNISTLTGGFDVTEIVPRLDKVEEKTYGDSYLLKDFNYGFTPLDNILYTREYYFSLDSGKGAKEIITLNYQSTGGGTFTIDLYKNKVIFKTLTVDLSQNPSSFSFEFKYIAEHSSQATMLCINSTSQFTLDNFFLEVHGTNIRFHRYDQDVKVSCYNREIYITRYVDGVFKYGRFYAGDEIDLDNLPYTAQPSDERCGGYTMCQYLPVFGGSSTLRSAKGLLCLEGINNKFYNDVVTIDETATVTQSNGCVRKSSGLLSGGMGWNAFAYSIYKKYPAFYYADDFSSYPFTKVNNVSNDWLLTVPVIHTYFDDKSSGDSEASGELLPTKIPLIVLHKDGYFYYLSSHSTSMAHKLMRGFSATAYRHKNNKYNYYVFDGTKTIRYTCTDYNTNLTANTIFKDCDCVYETYDNQIIKHTISTNTWSVETSEYFPEG